MAALAEACPIIGDDRRDERLRERWRAVLRRLQRPYEFSEPELAGLPSAPRPGPRMDGGSRTASV